MCKYPVGLGANLTLVILNSQLLKLYNIVMQNI